MPQGMVDRSIDCSFLSYFVIRYLFVCNGCRIAMTIRQQTYTALYLTNSMCMCAVDQRPYSCSTLVLVCCWLLLEATTSLLKLWME